MAPVPHRHTVRRGSTKIRTCVKALLLQNPLLVSSPSSGTSSCHERPRSVPGNLCHSTDPGHLIPKGHICPQRPSAPPLTSRKLEKKRSPKHTSLPPPQYHHHTNHYAPTTTLPPPHFHHYTTTTALPSPHYTSTTVPSHALLKFSLFSRLGWVSPRLARRTPLWGSCMSAGNAPAVRFCVF